MEQGGVEHLLEQGALAGGVPGEALEQERGDDEPEEPDDRDQGPAVPDQRDQDTGGTSSFSGPSSNSKATVPGAAPRCGRKPSKKSS